MITMKLKYININGYGVLVDESAEIKEGILTIVNDEIIKIKSIVGDNLIFHRLIGDNLNGETYSFHASNCYGQIIVAEKELNLDVPILPNLNND